MTQLPEPDLREQVSRLEVANQELLQVNSELVTQIVCLQEENEELIESERKTKHCVSKFIRLIGNVEMPAGLKDQAQAILGELLNHVFDGEDLRMWLF